MTSARHIAANRENARKSTGPKTKRGKSRASRNAVRHALSSANFGDPGLSDRVSLLAKAICNGERDPFVYDQAVIIAETQILLGRIRAARVAAIDAKPDLARAQLAITDFPLLDVELIDDHFNRGEYWTVVKAINRNTSAYRSWMTRMLSQMAARPKPPPCAQRDASLAESHSAERPDSIDHASELLAHAQILLALPKLLRFERYERRTLSRRKRALRRFNMLCYTT
jgi:hypothetical protein